MRGISKDCPAIWTRVCDRRVSGSLDEESVQSHRPTLSGVKPGWLCFPITNRARSSPQPLESVRLIGSENRDGIDGCERGPLKARYTCPSLTQTTKGACTTLLPTPLIPAHGTRVRVTWRRGGSHPASQRRRKGQSIQRWSLSPGQALHPSPPGS